MNRYQHKLHALGSDAVMTIVTDKDNDHATSLFSNLQSTIAQFEERFTRFSKDSELSKFNRSAGKHTTLSAEFIDLLTESKDMSEKTAGLYNPFILPGLQKVGYLNSWPNPSKKIEGLNFTKRSVVNIKNLIIDGNAATIPKNSALDFGGIGKGYLLDKLGLILDSENLIGYWISLGGDIICSGHDLDNQDWKVSVQAALEINKNIDVISNSQGQKLAIATSGVTKRRGVVDNKEWHHIIDPRTGVSSQSNVITATVTSKRAILADVYAKCIVIAGSKFADDYLKDKIIESFLLQIRDNPDKIKILRA